MGLGLFGGGGGEKKASPRSRRPPHNKKFSLPPMIIAPAPQIFGGKLEFFIEVFVVLLSLCSELYVVLFKPNLDSPSSP